MDKELDKALKDSIESMKKVSFKNRHGEVFTIHCDGILTFMSGDEIDAMVEDDVKIADRYIPLFNERFNIWDKEELYKLGQCLMELNK